MFDGKRPRSSGTNNSKAGRRTGDDEPFPIDQVVGFGGIIGRTDDSISR